MIFLAEGSGFAQIKSILQHALSLERAPSISLVRLANTEGLYQENLLKSYTSALDNVQYVAFAEGSAQADVLAAISAQAPDLAAVDIYAAGTAGFLRSRSCMGRPAMTHGASIRAGSRAMRMPN